MSIRMKLNYFPTERNKLIFISLYDLAIDELKISKPYQSK